jgi:hypothetical protein
MKATKNVRKHSITIESILNKGYSANKVIVVKKTIFHDFFNCFFGSILGFFFININELAILYFELPKKRKNEISKELEKIASYVSQWCSFNHKYKLFYNEEVIKMSLSEMVNCSINFSMCKKVLNLSEKFPDIWWNCLMKMKKLAKNSFEENFFIIKKLNNLQEKISNYDINKLFNLIQKPFEFKQFDSLVFLTPIQKYRSLKKQEKLTIVYFDKILEIYKEARHGSPVRKEIVELFGSFEFSKDQLIDGYKNQKTWTNMKRFFLNKINQLNLEEKEWLEIKNGVKKDIQLNNTVFIKTSKNEEVKNEEISENLKIVYMEQKIQYA